MTAVTRAPAATRSEPSRPLGVIIIVAVNLVGWVTTLGVWVVLHSTGQVPSVESVGSYWEKSYIGLVYGFSVADFMWSNLSLLLSIVGLWRMKLWGWAAAMMANAIWVYSMTVTLVRDVLVQATPEMTFFMFFAGFAVGATVYLWTRRSLFWDLAAGQ